MVETEVGGGFGIRGEFYPEDFLIPYLARKLLRPVAWIEDRSEHFRSANHSREQTHHIRIGVKASGEIVWLEDRVLNDMGAYIRTHGATVPTMTAAYLPGPYRIPAYRCEITCVLTNKTPTGTYRAPGRFEAAFVRERMMDLIAERLGLGATEIRFRNLVPSDEMPYDTGLKAHGTPVIYDSGDYEAHFRRSLEVFQYDQVSAWAAQMREQGRAVGVGIAWFVEKTGLGPWEYARVEVNESGTATVFSGLSNVGQGVLTTLAQIVADELAMDLDDVSVVLGDTDLVPYGHGSFASRGAVLAGNASFGAARKVKVKLTEAAAKLLECAVEDLVTENSSVYVRGAPDSKLSYEAVARSLSPSLAGTIGMSPGLKEEDFFYSDQMVYPFGVHLALVEVDRETGQLEILKYLVTYDVGRAINPRLIDGQIVGGFAQGLGGAVFEELRYDETGQLLSGSFMDYLMPTAAETPELMTLITEDAPSPMNPLGIKGAGEGGTVAVGAALANAVVHALGPGTRVSRLPLSPEYVRSLAERAASVAPDTATDRRSA
jgi:CO/xanthine dehydrogenase Mo-binding subunit